MKLLGDTILAKRLEDNYHGLIEIPSTVDPLAIGIRAVVMEVGSKFQHKDVVKPNDVIIVSKRFGTILDKTNDAVRLYDGEDILAILT